MRAWFQKYRQSRSPRERAVIGMLAAGISLVLFIWLLHSATDARARLGASTVILQEQAARLEADATALEHIRGAPLPLLSSKDLRAVLQARIDAAGLGRTLVRLVADNPDQAQMVLGSIAFVDWLALVSSLQSDHIRMENGRVEALSAPGLVGVSATFIRARNP